MEKLFDFEERELGMIQEAGEDNFLEMNRTWMNEEGGELSFIKNAANDKPLIQNFGRSNLIFLTFSPAQGGIVKSPSSDRDVAQCPEDLADS